MQYKCEICGDEFKPQSPHTFLNCFGIQNPCEYQFLTLNLGSTYTNT